MSSTASRRAGNISRVIDISAKVGHVVPTALLPIGGDARNPAMFIGNLGVFGPPDGTVPNEHVYRLTQAGHLAVRASGLEQVVGLVRRNGVLYALELSSTPGGPTPGTGAIVRLRRGAAPRDGGLGTHLPDRDRGRPRRRVLLSTQGFGFGAGQGQVLRITL